MVTVTHDELKDAVSMISAAAGELFYMRGFLRPTYFVGTENEIGIVRPPSDDKDESTALIRALMKEIGATFYIYVDEAWTVSSTEAFPENFIPSEHPDRREVVVLIGEAHGMTMVAQREIIRPKNKPPYLGPLKFNDYGNVSGRMTHLLDTMH